MNRQEQQQVWSKIQELERAIFELKEILRDLKTDLDAKPVVYSKRDVSRRARL